MNLVSHIVPDITPGSGGLADYSLLIARGLKQQGIVTTEFIVVRSDSSLQSEFKLTTLEAPSCASLKQALKDSSTVLLQYEGYGYQSKGCPRWLVSGLKQWKEAAAERRLIVFLHEVSGDGPWYSSAFWLKPLQRTIARELLAISDVVYYASASVGSFLEAECAQAKARYLGICSNVFELASPRMQVSESGAAVVFGTRGRREAVYNRLGVPETERLEALKVDTIIDIGEPILFKPAVSRLLRFEERGALSAEAVSQELSRASCGLIEYPEELLSKSGIFASYAGHALAPLVLGRDSKQEVFGGLTEGKHFLRLDSERCSSPGLNLNTIAREVHDWYQTHGVEKHIEVFANEFASGSHKQGTIE